MAERFVRLAGPYAPSIDPVNPDDLFTVPANKLYVIRDVTFIAKQVTGGGAGDPTYHLSVDNKDLLSVTATLSGGVTTERFTGSQPIQAGETASAYVDGVTATAEIIGPDQNFSIFGGGQIQHQAAGHNLDMGFPSSVILLTFHYRDASTTHAVPSYLDPETADVANFQLHTQAASSRGPSNDQSAGVDVSTLDITGLYDNAGGDNFSVYQTFATPDGELGALFQIQGIPYPLSIVQTATATGTTAETATVTMTPVDSNNLQFLYLYGISNTAADASTWSTPAGATELALSSNTLQGGGVDEAALFWFDPPVTNPAATWSTADMDAWAAIAFEVDSGGDGTTATTISGLVIE